MLSGVVGVIPTVLVAGVALKVTEGIFGRVKSPTGRRKTRKSTGRGAIKSHPGDFSNLGF